MTDAGQREVVSVNKGDTAVTASSFKFQVVP